MCSYTTFAVKVDLCAHTDSKNGIFTRRVYSAYIFDSYPLPLFRRLTMGGCYREKFFLILFFLILARYLVNGFLRLNNFFIFFVTSFLSDSYSILFRISVVLTHYKFSLDILLVWFRYIFLDYNFGFCVFRLIFTRWILLASISTCFSIVYSML